VAEQFGTLASLYPGRIDLGLGRAPGTDQAATRALRRYYQGADEFPNDVVELLQYFEQVVPGQQVRAVPGAGIEVEAWILGSSLFGAQLAAALGLPYAFASHFAPDMLQQALAIYREKFRPSARLERPRVLLALNVVAANSDGEARRLFTSQQLGFINLRRGRSGLVQPPVADINAVSTPEERAGVDRALACAVIGAPATVARGVEAFIERHRPDELMLTANVFDPAARLHSFELAADVLRQMRVRMSA
jgi:luciferase family oxidoreductase group 1